MARESDSDTLPPEGGKRKRGRPKGPCSEAELAQRRAAPITTGRHAKTALAQALPPCKPATCLNGGLGTCSTKDAVPSLHVCIPSLGDPKVVDAYLRAIKSGDTSGIQELAAASLGAGAMIEQRGLKQLLDEGLTVDRPIVGKTSDGGVEVIDFERVPHPAAKLVLEFGGKLGHTADQQLVTPKSTGVAAAHRGIAAMGDLAAARQLQAELAGSPGGASHE